jgi:hypothetical protein
VASLPDIARLVTAVNLPNVICNSDLSVGPIQLTVRQFILSVALHKIKFLPFRAENRKVSLLRLLYVTLLHKLGHAVTQWLRHCATNRKFAGSIPDGFRNFH